MAIPPKVPPASDLEGVRQDESGTVEAAIAADQNAGDLERARKQAVGRPRHSSGEGNADDRSR